MDDLSDLDLVEAAKAGDTTSFGELVRRHGPRLLALARQVVGPDAAEDVIQEAMVDAYRGSPASPVMQRWGPGCTASPSTAASRSVGEGSR